MDIVVIFNGLGNQMSQFSFFLAKKDLGCRCLCLFDPRSVNRHNGSELNKIFGIEYERGIRIWLYKMLLKLVSGRRIARFVKYMNISLIYEPISYDYSEVYLKQGSRWLNYYIGGWHSEKYFKSIRYDVLSHFRFSIKDETDDSFLSLVEHIKDHYQQSVSIHIRRGDYLNSKPGDWYYYGGVATIDYYKKAVKYIKRIVESPVFYVFSDDIEWCRSNFVGDFYFVNCNTADKSWRDMFLMTKCKHHIIANSSFSWWGAWLCEDRDGIVIRPERFLANVEIKDFYPEDWLMISEEK